MVNRLLSWGAVQLKQYMQPRRDQRQWVSDVARRAGLMDEVWPQRRPFGPYYWVNDDALRNDTRPLDGWRR